jgi:hypothetical protein
MEVLAHIGSNRIAREYYQKKSDWKIPLWLEKKKKKKKKKKHTDVVSLVWSKTHGETLHSIFIITFKLIV